MKALRPLATALALLLALAGLTVLSAPAQAAGVPAVRSLRVVSQVDHAAKVAWAAPDTSRVVARYRVAWADRVVRLAPSARSYVVQGLRNGVATTVSVRPVYRSGALGDRRVVRAMGATKPGTPAAPALTGTDIDSGARKAVAISWAAVAANGPAPVQYRVQRTNASGSTVVCDWTTATSCSNAVPNDGAVQTYQVRARNAEATSARAAGHRGDYISPLGAGRSIVAEAPAPMPTIMADRGAACGPAVGTTCPGAAAACTSTCWFIVAIASGFPASSTCRALTATGGPFGSPWTQSNGAKQTPNWVGSNVSFQIACDNGAHSRTYTF